MRPAGVSPLPKPAQHRFSAGGISAVHPPQPRAKTWSASNPSGFVRTPFRHIPKKPFRGFGMWRKGWDMFGPSLGLTLRAARSGPALRLSRFVPDESVEPKWARPHTPSATYQKTPFGVLVSGGRGGIRTHGWLPIAGFQDRCNRPLCHPSDGGCLAVRAAGANRSQSLAQVAEAAHIGQQHFGYGDRAVGVLVVLHHRDQGATDGHA